MGRELEQVTADRRLVDLAAEEALDQKALAEISGASLRTIIVASPADLPSDLQMYL